MSLPATYGANVLSERDFFFFSSRRRHTRCYRDWSSDVCSSDLEAHGRSVTDVHHGGFMQKGADNFQQLFQLAIIAEAVGGFVELFPIRCFLSGSLSLFLFR